MITESGGYQKKSDTHPTLVGTCVMGGGSMKVYKKGKERRQKMMPMTLLSSSPSFKKTTIFTLHQFPGFSNSEFSNGKSEMDETFVNQDPWMNDERYDISVNPIT